MHTNVNRGFTLIELLVVVLIIGILAAIAVPQYQKAVLKSRFSSLMPTTQAIRDGNEMYYMTNGRYADALNKLDVTTVNTDEMTLTLSNDEDYAYTMATRPNINNNLIMYQKHSVNFPGEIHCEALKGNTQAEWLCETGLKAIRNLGENITPNYTTYVLEGTGTGMPYWAKDIDCNKAISMGLSCQAVRNAYGAGRQMCINGVCRTIYENEDGSYTSITCQANSDGVCTANLRSVTYDANGNKLTERTCSSVDSSGNCTAYSRGYNYTYDANGNKLTERSCSSVDNSGTCTAYSGGYNYTYDANGNMLTNLYCQTVDSSGNCTSYSSGRWAAAYSYTYDANGNKLTERRCSSVDSNGNCTAYNKEDAYDYTYDANGNMLTKRTCSSVNSSGNCTAYSGGYDYTYDANGNQLTTRTCQTVDSSGNCTYNVYSSYDYTYDANGNKASSQTCKIMDSSGNCTAYSSGTYYTYDANGNMLTARSCTVVDSSCINSGAFVYTYDANGNKLTERKCSIDSRGNCVTYNKDYAYDYTYDANGNKLTERTCSSVDSSGNCTAYSYGTDYTYDANGNKTSQRKCSSFDSSEKCTSYAIYDNYDYTYDDNGKQIASQYCRASDVNTSTGGCITYASTDIKAN